MRKITDVDGIIRKMYGQGYSVGAIGRHVGRHTASVSASLARLGLRERTHPNRLTEQQRIEILEAYNAGELSGSIAKRYGKTGATIREIARKGGALIYGKGNRDRVFTQPEIDTMKSMWRNGESQHQIAITLGTTSATISSILRMQVGMLSKRHASRGRHGNWKGGRRVNGDGYVLILVEPTDLLAAMSNRGGYVLEHRLVMARKLGRPLLPTETVHHIDGNTKNNAPDNLQLRQGKHGKHTVMVCADCGSTNVTAKPL